MNRLIAVFLLTFAMQHGLLSAGTDPARRIAVLDFTATGINEPYALVIRNKIEVALFKKNLNVIERRSLQKVLFELGRDTACKDTKCAVMQGKLVSADYVVVGDIVFAGQYVITARIVDVNDGRIVFADSAVSADKSDILNVIQKLAGNLSESISKTVHGKTDANLTGRQNDSVPAKKKIKSSFDVSTGYVVPIEFLKGNVRQGYSLSISGGASVQNYFIGIKAGYTQFFNNANKTYAYLFPFMASFRYDYSIKYFYLSPGLSFGALFNSLAGSRGVSVELMVNPGIAVGLQVTPMFRLYAFTDYYCIIEKKRGIQFFVFGLGFGFSI